MQLRLYAASTSQEPVTKRWPTRRVKRSKLAQVADMSCSLAARKAVRMDELTDHPMLRLLARPNPHMDGFRMMELTDLYLEMTGTAYWYKTRGAAGAPEELWLVPPTEIYAVRDQYGYTLRYEAVRSKKEIPVEDVVFFSFPDLFAPYSRGKGPAQAGFGQISLQDKTEAYNHATMENRGRPDVFIIPKEPMGEAEALRTELRFNRKYRRAGAGGAMVMSSDVEVAPAGFSNKDLEMFQLQEASKLNVANAFSVPISFLRNEDSNRAVAEAGHYQHARLALRPRGKRLAGAINLQLSGDFDERLVAAYDDPVPEDVETTLKVRESNLNNAVTTVNEERDDMGLAPSSWGDKPWIPVAKSQPSDDEDDNARGGEPAPAPASGQKPPGTEEDDEEDDQPDDEVKAVLDFVCGCGDHNPLGFKRAKLAKPELLQERGGTLAEGWEHANKKGGHARRMPSPGRMEAALKGVFREQKRAVIGSILGKSLRATVIKAAVPDRIDLSGWSKKMSLKTRPIVEMFYEEGAKGLIARLDLSRDFDVSSQRTADAISKATMKFCDETNATTSMELGEALDRLRKDLAEGLLSQENTTAELTKRVSAVFDRAEAWRAETIAMSESSRALHAGQSAAAKESGLDIRLKWLLSQDACPICEEIADSQSEGVKPGELFASIGDGPYSDVAYPPAHPRCQCTMVEEVVGEKPTSSSED